MSLLNLVLPSLGSPDLTEDPKINNALTAIQNWANGNIDSSNLSAATSQSAGLNTSGSTMKGTVSNLANSAWPVGTYAPLSPADQVTVTLPANGLIRVWYIATVAIANPNNGQVAIFVDGTQLTGYGASFAAPQAQSATANSPAGQTYHGVVCTFPAGLTFTQPVVDYTGEVTTGQTISSQLAGGPCDIYNLVAGMHTIDIRYNNPSGGSASATNRHLWVQAISFS